MILDDCCVFLGFFWKGIEFGMVGWMLVVMLAE